MKRHFALALSVLFAMSAFAQSDPQTSNTTTRKRTSSAPVSKQLEDMKDAISTPSSASYKIDIPRPGPLPRKLPSWAPG